MIDLSLAVMKLTLGWVNWPVLKVNIVHSSQVSNRSSAG